MKKLSPYIAVLFAVGVICVLGASFKAGINDNIVLNPVLTGSSATSAIDISGQWNTSGNPVLIKGAMTNTASGATSKFISFLAGAGAATEVFSVDKIGTVSASLVGGYSFLGTSTFIYPRLSTTLSFYISGTDYVEISQTQLQLKSTHALGFSSGLIGAASDVILTRKAAAVLQLGAAAASVVSPQTITAAPGLGTDKAGATRVDSAGASTGTGIGGSMIRQTSLSSTTSSTENSYTTREYVYAGETTLTESAATGVVTISLAAGKFVGVDVFATTHSDDGTDFSVSTDIFTFSGVAKATVITGQVSAIVALSTAASSISTLTTTWTYTDNGNNTFTLKNNAVSSLTQTTLKTKWQIRINGDGVHTVTPL